MNRNSPKSLGSGKKNSIKNDSFLEALRNIGGSTLSSAKNDLIKPGAKDIFNSLSPFGQPELPPDDIDLKNRQDSETEWEKRFNRQRKQIEVVRREEKIIFTRKERETQTQVKSLREEIKKLAFATGQLAQDVQIASMQEEVNPGTYHLNFFQRLLSIIKNLRAQVQESSSWLALWNKKSKKKNYYWNQFKKSGSSFSLHHDRAIATQAG